MFSVIVHLIHGTQTLFLMMLKGMRLDKRYNSPHSVDTNLFLSNLDHPKIKMSSEHLFLNKMYFLKSVCLERHHLSLCHLFIDTPSPFDTLDESFCMHSRVSANEMKSKTLKPLFNVPKRLMIVSKWL